jgi:heme/copper-type cytochrome/quinol oxidase subunit 4
MMAGLAWQELVIVFILLVIQNVVPLIVVLWLNRNDPDQISGTFILMVVLLGWVAALVWLRAKQRYDRSQKITRPEDL